MNALWAEVLRQGGSILSMVIRTREVRPKSQKASSALPEGEGVEEELHVEIPQLETIETTKAPKRLKAGKKEESAPLETSYTGQSEAELRLECISKHLGDAKTCFGEGIDRAVDAGVNSEGVKEKVQEALTALAGIRPDIEKMLPLEDVKAETDYLDSGIRNLRKSVWESGLHRGEGTLDDLKAAHTWASIILAKTYEFAEKHPGTACIREEA